MRHILTLILCYLLTAVSTAQQPIEVLASASMFADMATNIGGDRVSVETIVPIGGDPHLYSPRPSDAEKVQAADVVLINGLTFEGWIAKLIANSGTQALVATITEGIVPRKSDEYENSYDPHAWMSAANGLVYVDNIVKALAGVSPADAEYFQNNAAEYKKKLMELHSYMKSEMQKIPESQRVLITSHDAFAYFGEDYGLELNALKGISTEEETQSSDMLRVAKAIKETGVKAIFVESTISPKMIKQIATDNGVRVGGELYADSLGPKGGDGDTYVKMLKHNCDTIVAALTRVESESDTPSNSDGSSWWLYLVLGVVMLLLIVALVSKFK